MRNKASKRSLPAGARETSPLVVGLIGISIPVALLALAAVGGSVVVLVLAILAMLGVGGATLTFVLLLAGEHFEQLDTGGDAAE